MKRMTIKFQSQRRQRAPRNPLVSAALLRHAGPHGGLRKSERQRAQRHLRGALREMNEGP